MSSKGCSLGMPEELFEAPNEIDFKEIVSLASYITKAPVVSIGIVGSDKQWLRARLGIELDSLSKDEFICNRVLESKEILIVEDLMADPRFVDSPYIKRSNPFRFYFGAPIMSEDGSCLGTLCLLDYTPRILCEQQLTCLQALAHQVGHTLRLKDYHAIIKAQDDKLIEINKAATLGLYSMMIAHEINNPLSVIKGYAQIAINSHSAGKDWCTNSIENYQSILKMSSRIEKIVNAIKFYSRNGNHDPLERFSLNQIIDETIELIKFTFSQKNITFTCILPEQETYLVCRPSEIAQVLLNLLNNAIDAISNLSDKWIELEVKQVEKMLEFSVTDSGTGMSENIAKNLTKPFFTTKARTKGTGLGLYITHLVIKAHLGEFFVDLKAPTTKFVFRLPMV